MAKRKKLDREERILNAAASIREASKRIWDERRKKSQDAQFAWTIANWVPSEEMARGINKVLDAAKKKDIPIRFAENWNGELQRLGYRAIQHHCQRYGIVLSLEDVRDAIAEIVADLWEKGKLAASLERSELVLSKEDKRQFCHSVVNAYRRYIHSGKKTQGEATLDIILGMGRYYQWRPAGPEEELNWVELKESLRQTLTRVDYTACQLILQGYSRDEIAETLKTTRRTLRRRLDQLPSGKLLRILR